MPAVLLQRAELPARRALGRCGREQDQNLLPEMLRHFRHAPLHAGRRVLWTNGLPLPAHGEDKSDSGSEEGPRRKAVRWVVWRSFPPLASFLTKSRITVAFRAGTCRESLGSRCMRARRTGKIGTAEIKRPQRGRRSRTTRGSGGSAHKAFRMTARGKVNLII